MTGQQNGSTGFIYISGSSLDDIRRSAKIGYSDTIKSLPGRLRAWNKVAHPEKTWLLAIVRGNQDNERAIHSYFREDKDDRPGSSETFYLSDRLLNYVAWLRQLDFVTPQRVVPYNDSEAVDEALNWASQLDARPFDEWCPDASRTLGVTGSGLPSLLLSDNPFGLPTHNPHSSEDFYTPDSLIDRVKRVMGGIDLDPASHPKANNANALMGRIGIGAARIYTIEDDGLAQPWCGRVWLNPPFSDWDKWALKALEEFNSGRVTEMLFLTNGGKQPGAGYFDAAMRRAAAICLCGRIKFDGLQKYGPWHNSVILYFGTSIGRFKNEFDGYENGTTWCPL